MCRDYLHGSEEEPWDATYYQRARRWTAWGAVCAGVEMEGHGRSEGTRAYIKVCSCNVRALLSDGCYLVC